MKKKLFVLIPMLLIAIALCGCCSHEWEEATCTEPSTCSMCDKTQGEALGHVEAEYEEWSIDAEELIYAREKWCERCEDFYDREVGETVTSFVGDRVLLISPDDFAKRFDDSVMNGYVFESNKVYDEYASFYSDSNTVFYEIKNEENNDETVGMYSFVDNKGKTIPVIDSYSDGVATQINFLIENTLDVSAIVFATVQAIDPALDYSESADVGQSIVDNVGNLKGLTKNSINYVLYQDKPYHYFVVTFLNGNKKIIETESENVDKEKSDSQDETIAKGYNLTLEDINKIVEVQKKSKIQKMYPDVVMESDDIEFEGAFYGIPGRYRISWFDDGEFWQVLFKWDFDDETIDVKRTVNELKDSLGRFDSYDTKFNCYSWMSSDKIDYTIDFYVEDGIWFREK